MKPIRYDTDRYPSDELAAAGLAIAICAKAKVDTWRDYEIAVANGDKAACVVASALDLDVDQVELLTDNPDVVRTIAVKPLRTISQCSQCGAWVVVSGGAVSRCLMTWGCTGEMVRASRARLWRESSPDT